MAEVSMKQLLEAGVHFGHQTSRWNPKMKPYIFGARNGIYIIDLQQTVKLLAGRLRVRARSRRERRLALLFVGTKKQAQDAVIEEAERCGACTTSATAGSAARSPTSRPSSRASSRLTQARGDARGSDAQTEASEEARVARAEPRAATGWCIRWAASRRCASCPDALFVIDTIKEEIAVKEANKLGIPVVAVVDTELRSGHDRLPHSRQRRRDPRHPPRSARAIADAGDRGPSPRTRNARRAVDARRSAGAPRLLPAIASSPEARTRQSKGRWHERGECHARCASCASAPARDDGLQEGAQRGQRRRREGASSTCARRDLRGGGEARRPDGCGRVGRHRTSTPAARSAC